MMHVFYSKRMSTFVDDHVYVCAIVTDQLSVVWREMNVVEGDEIPLACRTRSMCVGDVIVDIIGSRAWRVAPIGFTELTQEEVKAFVLKVPQYREEYHPRYLENGAPAGPPPGSDEAGWW